MTPSNFTYYFENLAVGRWSVHGAAEINFNDVGAWEISHIMSAVADDGMPMPKTDVAAALMREESQHIRRSVSDELLHRYRYEG